MGDCKNHAIHNEILEGRLVEQMRTKDLPAEIQALLCLPDLLSWSQTHKYSIYYNIVHYNYITTDIYTLVIDVTVHSCTGVPPQMLLSLAIISISAQHLQHLLHLPAHHKSVKPSSGLVQTLCNELCRETFLKLLTALCVISSIGDKNLGVSLESSDAKERKVDDGLKITDQKHVPRVMVLT